MVLPVGTEVDLPMIPPLGKESIPALTAFVGCRFIANQRIRIFGQQGWIRRLLILLIILPFITAELNHDPVYIGGRILPAMSHYDALSAVIRQFIFFMPFFLGRQLFRTYEEQLLVFKVITVAGLLYSFPMLFEVRMSPQLHTWIYGYFPHSFLQQYRMGGFRPVVFMGHGLWVAFFAMVALVASITFWKLKKSATRLMPPTYLCSYLFFVLLLCKTLAALLYAVFAATLIKMSSFKLQIRTAQALALIAFIYPNLSMMNLIPYDKIVDWAGSVSMERAQSLDFRFDNEKILLDHARQRLFFGWGGWGRNRVYSEETGGDDSITDGGWIIVLGQYGWIGFIAEFGLILASVLTAKKVIKKIDANPAKVLLGAHTLLVALIMFDQLPNASLAPWLWLLIGALIGREEDINQLKQQKITYPWQQQIDTLNKPVN